MGNAGEIHRKYVGKHEEYMGNIWVIHGKYIRKHGKYTGSIVLALLGRMRRAGGDD